MPFTRDSFRGSFPALITPMKGGGVDEVAFRRLVSWQIAQGSHGLVPCGTTGESPTLSHEEHMRVVEICVEEAGGRVPVIAGAGSNSTTEAIALTRHAKECGADAVKLQTYTADTLTIPSTKEGFVLRDGTPRDLGVPQEELRRQAEQAAEYLAGHRGQSAAAASARGAKEPSA